MPRVINKQWQITGWLENNEGTYAYTHEACLNGTKFNYGSTFSHLLYLFSDIQKYVSKANIITLRIEYTTAGFLGEAVKRAMKK